MSHAMGEVIHDGRVVGFFEYNGTCDVACNRIFCDRNNLWDNHWRTQYVNDAACVCGEESPGQEVILYADYADGFHWPATACLTCGVILTELNPWDGPCRGCATSFGCVCYPLIQDGHPLR